MPEELTKQKERRRILSVPLTPEQMSELARRSGPQPLSAFVRGQLFPANDNKKPKNNLPRPALKVAFAAKVLALLGPASTSLTALANAFASGLLPFAPDTEAAILKACADIAEMKSLLMKALGIRER